MLAALAVAAASLLAGAVPSAMAAGTAASSPLATGVQPVCGGPVPAGEMRCLAYLRSEVSGSQAPEGYSPADLESAYSLPAPSSGAGTGHTVAVVDAYDDPSAESDLDIYRSEFGLPACTTTNGCFRKVDQSGGTNYPAYDQQWAAEISLDLDMVSGTCADCHLLLVEAASESTTDLVTAEDTAVRLGATEVSDSWGGPEAADETEYDSHFGHPGVPITAGAGDDGYGVSWPAASPYVIAVGGTSLEPASGTSRGWSEAAWSGTGSGCSAYEAQPSWQHSVTSLAAACSDRATADVSAVADPETGVSMYDSNLGASGGNWLVAGGTSAASPIIASVYALAAGAPPTDPATTLYNSAGPSGVSPGLNDVTAASDGTCGSILCQAAAGWDGPTGLGTPDGLSAFSATQTGSTSTPTTTSLTATPTTTDAGQPVSMTATITPAAGYGGSVSGSVTFEDSGNPLATIPVNSFDQAQLSTSSLAPGSHELSAAYGGGGSLTSSQSASVAVTIQSAPSPTATAYSPLQPYRICDTRQGTGTECSGSGGDSRLGPGASLAFQVTGVVGPQGQSVPAGAQAVALNVTAVSGSTGTYLTAYPTGAGVPTASTLNVVAGAIQANLVVVALGSGGQVSIYNSLGSIDVAVDVEGYFAAPPGSTATPGLFHPLAPIRMCDTRSGTATECSGSPLGPGQWTRVDLAGAGSVPADRTAAAVAMNLTAVEGSRGTFLSVVPTSPSDQCPAGAPAFSNLNVDASTNLPNRVIVPLGPNQDVCVYNSEGTINFILDVNGWFGNGQESSPGALYYPVSPVRLCDTRPAASVGYVTECSGSSLAPAVSLSVPVAGMVGVPLGGSGGAPVAVVANVTAVSGSAATFFTLYPANDSMPTASDLNVEAGQIVPNLSIVQLGSSGATPDAFELFNDQGTINAIVDIEGWFA